MAKAYMDLKISDEKSYVLQYTRRSICLAEDYYGQSFLALREPTTFSDAMKLVDALLYGALASKNQDIKPDQVADIHDEIVDAGYLESDLLENLMNLLRESLDPQIGGQKKELTLLRK